jgi:hypothetical protein
MSARYLSARQHVLRTAALLRLLELTIETLIVYRRTYQTFNQADQILFNNCSHLFELTRRTATATAHVTIGVAIVQSAIYFISTSLKQYEIMLEPTLHNESNHDEYETIIG